MFALLGSYPLLHVTSATDPYDEFQSSETIPFSIDGTVPQHKSTLFKTAHRNKLRKKRTNEMLQSYLTIL
jgi:hypothetical protein